MYKNKYMSFDVWTSNHEADEYVHTNDKTSNNCVSNFISNGIAFELAPLCFDAVSRTTFISLMCVLHAKIDGINSITCSIRSECMKLLIVRSTYTALSIGIYVCVVDFITIFFFGRCQGFKWINYNSITAESLMHRAQSSGTRTTQNAPCECIFIS